MQNNDIPIYSSKDFNGMRKAGSLAAKILDELQKIIVSNKQGQIVNSGALAINTGKFTGRSPKDRYIDKDEITAEKVWWGDINIPIDQTSFENLRFPEK